MKKLFLMLAMMLPIFAFAQKGFDTSVKIVGNIGIDDYKNKSFGAEAVFGYRFNEYFRVGLGTGISWCDLLFEKETSESYEYRESEAYVPLFVNGKANFIKNGISPYLSLSVGYSFLIPFSDYAKNADLGFMANPSFGIDFPLSKGSLFAEVGYKYQAMNFEGYGFDLDMNYSQITLGIGYNF